MTTGASYNNLVSIGVKVTVTTETTCYVADNFAILTRAHITNESNGAETVTLTWYDSSTAGTYDLLFEKAIAGDEYLVIEFERGVLMLEDGDEIRVTASASCDVILTVVESLGRSG